MAYATDTRPLGSSNNNQLTLPNDWGQYIDIAKYKKVKCVPIDNKNILLTLDELRNKADKTVDKYLHANINWGILKDYIDRKQKPLKYVKKDEIVREIEDIENKWIPKKKSSTEELREYVFSAAVKGPYVKVFVPDVPNVSNKLNAEIQRDIFDMEGEWGAKIDILDDGVVIIFKIKESEIHKRVKEITDDVLKSTGFIRTILDDCNDMSFNQVKDSIDGIHQKLTRQEEAIDHIYALALNEGWNPPQTECLGFSSMVPLLERLHDELEYLILDTAILIDLIEKKYEKRSNKSMEWKILCELWRNWVKKSLNICENVLNSYDVDEKTCCGYSLSVACHDVHPQVMDDVSADFLVSAA